MAGRRQSTGAGANARGPAPCARTRTCPRRTATRNPHPHRAPRPAPPRAPDRRPGGGEGQQLPAGQRCGGPGERRRAGARSIRAFSFSGYDSAKTVPTVVLRNEDYGRITRLVAGGTPVTLEFTIVNRDYPAGRTSYNAIAEIVGTDKAGEVIMLGGHLDSWHAATGATDNAVGCAVMMEAVRILSAIGVKPRRTIRVALWGGEEQGLIGSRAYVEQHFGTAENPKPAFAIVRRISQPRLGTGRVRGANGVRTDDRRRLARAVPQAVRGSRCDGRDCDQQPGVWR